MSRHVPLHWPEDESTSSILKRLGYTHRPTGVGYAHEVLRDGVVVHTGDCFSTNAWLEETRQVQR